MTDSERLNKLKNLCDEYFSTWDTKDQYQIGFVFMQDAEWLVKEAGRAAELDEAVDMFVSGIQKAVEETSCDDTREYLDRALSFGNFGEFGK